MSDNGKPEHPDRSTFLTVVLALMVGGGILLFFTAVLGTWFLVALAVVAGIVLVGGLHYFLWGRSLTHATKGEREEAEARAAAEEWQIQAPQERPRRF